MQALAERAAKAAGPLINKRAPLTTTSQGATSSLLTLAGSHAPLDHWKPARGLWADGEDVEQLGMEQLQTSNKPSGLPRPASRLPVLTKRSSHVFPPRSQETPEPSKPTICAPRLQKRASYQTVLRSSQAPLKEALVAPKPLGQPSGFATTNRAAPVARTSTSSRPAVLRPSSRASQRDRRPQSPAKPSVTTEDDENHDQLGSLDSFRSASRQGFYDDALPTEFVQPIEELSTPTARKASRPSLSDRTLESLQNLPLTPKERRRSSFFAPQSPMDPPSRPASSLSRHGGGHSRPGTSDGNFIKPALPASAKPPSRTIAGTFGLTPKSINRRSVSSTFASRLQSAHEPLPPMPRSSSPDKRASSQRLAMGLSKTLAARPSKPRPALSDAFAPLPKPPAPPSKSDVADAKGVLPNSANSSSVLRQQIAAAKAAARKAKEAIKYDSPQNAAAVADRAYAMEMNGDPFNLAPKDGKHMLRNRIHAALMDGKLNISAMGLKAIPDEVMSMYDSASLEGGKVSWAEVVDLKKFIAADNELEELTENVFPDASAEDLVADDQGSGNQLGGLEALDFHGNLLRSLPLGLRRLERITSLNLSHNRLDNSALDVVAQIKPLRELKLGHNNLSGNLPPAFCNLAHLETLDLQANRLLGLPEALRELVGLRVLNLSGNQLTTLPMEALQELPLTDLDSSNNALIGSLFPLGGAGGHNTLRLLNVANNSLAALTFSDALDLPKLQTLDVTNNHLTNLPPMSRWTGLITLAAGDNKISELPQGFTSLLQLRNASFTSNSLRVVRPEIANMEALENLILASNPLQQKKYLTMSAADIKRDLRTRLGPAERNDNMLERETDEVSFNEGRALLPATIIAKWALKTNGFLDLAHQGLSDDINDLLCSFLKSNEVQQLHLQGNKLTSIPPALWLGQHLKVLDLSNNPLNPNILPDDLELPALQDLNLASCDLRTLEPLTTQLQAPNLQTLNVTANRLSGLIPMLRTAYPRLIILFASDNKFNVITADALRGLQTINLAGNDIQQLPAEVGLLWNEGLRSLEVGRNAFRVPGYTVLEKGTEATLRWLREKLPAYSGHGAGMDEDVG